MTYGDMLAHTSRHNIKEWLLRGAREEDARSIYEAVRRQSSHRLARKLAELLTSGDKIYE